MTKKDKQIILDVSDELFLKLIIWTAANKTSIPDLIIDLINDKFKLTNFNHLIANNTDLNWFDVICDLERGYYG